MKCALLVSGVIMLVAGIAWGLNLKAVGAWESAGYYPVFLGYAGVWAVVFAVCRQRYVEECEQKLDLLD